MTVRSALAQEPLDLFWQFICERQKVWYRRTILREDPPWTDDEVLQKYRFTNIYRELDPGTQYAIQNILEVDASRRDKIFNVMMYRLIGRLETHEDLGFQSLDSFDADKFESELKYRRDQKGETVFTGAYMVAGYSQMGSSDKVENIAAIFEGISSDDEFFNRLSSPSSVEDAYNIIRSQPGFGNFLSYQVLVDLLYSVDYYDGESVLPFSANDWSSPGPGAQKGIKRLTNELTGIDRLKVMRWLHQNQQQEFDRLNIDFPYLMTEDSEKVKLSLADIQNCLCEFYKYHKILNSDGRARRRFRNSNARSAQELKSIYKSAPSFSIEKSQ